jgi:hypothetical protein
MNSLYSFRTVEQVQTICSVGVLIASLEQMTVEKQFYPGRFLDRSVSVFAGSLSRALSGLLTSSRIVYFLLIRVLCAGILILAGVHQVALPLWLTGLVAGVLFASAVANNIAHPFGLDGSDHMNLVLLGSTAMAQLVGTQVCGHLALCFVAAQLVLAYVTAGVAKAFGWQWRRGSAVGRVLRTTSFGSPAFAAMLRRRPLTGKLLTWTVVLYEVFFPVAFIGPRWVCIAMLCGGVLMHSAIAVLMGLNGFLWSFVACYPAATYVHECIWGR